MQEMMRQKSLLVALVVCLVVCGCFADLPLPSSGLYVSFSNVALSSSAVSMSTELINGINSYTNWSTVSGSSSEASYTFYNWKVVIAAVDPEWKTVGDNEFMIGWNEFNFSIQSDYHICSKSWPNPCEEGNLYIYTTDSYTKLYLNTILDMTQTPPFVNVTSSELDFRANGILIYVHCTNDICLIPVDDIANAVAANFVTVFEVAVAKAARTAVAAEVSKFRTEFSFTDDLGLDFESNWWFLPGNDGGQNGAIFVPTNGGFYTNVSEVITFPPFSPSFTPPLSYLQNPKEDFNIEITEYFFQSFTWALSGLGFFNKVITSTMVPKDSPVQLSTDDAFFQQVVPGLTAYPHMDITVTTKLIETSIPTIDANGVHVWGTNISIDFALSNSTYSHHGWTLSNVFNLDLTVAASISGNLIIFNTSLTNFSANVDVIESDCGTISGAGFVSLYQLLESQVKLPGFTITLPPTFTVSNPSVAFYSQFIGFGADFGVSKTQLGGSKVPPVIKPKMSIN